MVEPINACSQPNDGQCLWRYMDFSKFVDLISNGKLFFSRSDKLGDPFEGTYTALHLNVADLDSNPATEEMTSSLQSRHMEIAASSDNRKFMYVHCWHGNDGESAAMWPLYNLGNEGVAIRTTFGSLKDSLALAVERIYSGAINYLDFRTERIEETKGFIVFMTKRKSFEHEKEIRLILWSIDDVIHAIGDQAHEPPPGKQIEVDLDILIEKLYVSPTSQHWFEELVRKSCAKYALKKEVVRSDLASSPFF